MLHYIFPCPHLHLHRPLFLNKLLLLLDLGSNTSPQEVLWASSKPQTFPFSLIHPGSLSPEPFLVLSSVHPRPVLTSPPVTSSMCSWESCFQSSVTCPREIYDSWTECFTPKTDALERETPLCQEDNWNKEKVASIFRETPNCQVVFV